MEPLHRIENTLFRGADLKKASRALILVHGRGDASDGMLDLAQRITDDPNLALVLPKATNHTWYPRSFLAEWPENQPWLDDALGLLHTVVTQMTNAGISLENIYLLGFSQGACLALEYATRHAQRYGGLMILSGALIGPQLELQHYQGDFGGTPILMGCSDRDAHIPLTRVQESAEVVQRMGAAVDLRIYAGMGHVINDDELHAARRILGSHL